MCLFVPLARCSEARLNKPSRERWGLSTSETTRDAGVTQGDWENRHDEAYNGDANQQGYHQQHTILCVDAPAQTHRAPRNIRGCPGSWDKRQGS
jgi:hypothetical protein